MNASNLHLPDLGQTKRHLIGLSILYSKIEDIYYLAHLRGPVT